MTEQLVEKVAEALYGAWYQHPLSGPEKKKLDPPTTWFQCVEVHETHPGEYPAIERVVILAREEARAAIPVVIAAMKEAGWVQPPDGMIPMWVPDPRKPEPSGKTLSGERMKEAGWTGPEEKA